MSPARARRPKLVLPEATGDDLADLAHLCAEMGPDGLAEWASTLDADDLAVVESAWAQTFGQGWRSSPAAMAAYLDPTHVDEQGVEVVGFNRYRYIDLLSSKFVDAVEGRSTRQIWNLPGRYGKTTLLRWGIAWTLDRTEGRARSIYVSYGDDLALETGAWLLARLRQHAAVLRAQLMRDRAARDRFVTERGGGVLCAGLDTAIIGFGAGDGGVLIVDDPHKNWQEAHSEAKRQHVAMQFKGTLRNRLDSESTPIIVVHHRVHEDDLSGRLKAEAEAATGDEWEMVVLPALADVDDPLGRAVGEPLEPARFDLDDVLSRHRGMSSYLVSALEQQAPSPEEGTELLRAWFQLEEHTPTRPDDAVSSWDLKLKNREAGDFVVGQVWWRVAGGYWLIDQLRGQWDHGTTANAIALLAVRHPEVRTHLVEAAGAADEVIAELRKAHRSYVVDDEMAGKLAMNDRERKAVQALRRRGLSGLKPESASEGSKQVRARSYIAPNAEAGDVHLPANAPWLDHYLDEVAAFPTGKHDDQVDASSQALKRLSRVGRAKVSKAKTGAKVNPPLAVVQPGQGPTRPTRPTRKRGAARVSTGTGRTLRRR